jgi:hypothetical protein
MKTLIHENLAYQLFVLQEFPDCVLSLPSAPASWF